MTDSGEIVSQQPLVMRPLLTEEGESLFLSANPFVAEDRYEGFLEYTGLTESETMFSLLSAIPLPLRLGSESVMRQAAEFNVEAMWAPLFWLPEKTASAQMVDGRQETVNEVCARICLELLASGLYDPESGQFVDVLALAGIDIEDESDKDRCASWLLGTPDPVLDGIDLSAYLEVPGDPEWAVRESQLVFTDLLHGSWAVLCADLSDMLSELDERDGQGNHLPLDEVKEMALLLFDRAGLSLASVELDPAAQPADEFWSAMSQRTRDYEGDVPGFLDSIASDAGQWLKAVQEHYEPKLESFNSKLNDIQTRLEDAVASGT